MNSKKSSECFLSDTEGGSGDVHEGGIWPKKQLKTGQRHRRTPPRRPLTTMEERWKAQSDSGCGTRKGMLTHSTINTSWPDGPGEIEEDQRCCQGLK